MRKQADNVNKAHYDDLKGEEIIFNIKIATNCTIIQESKKPLSFEQIARTRDLTQEQLSFEIEKLITDARTIRQLALKIGTVVMCTVNYDIEGGICNGSQGIIVDFIENSTTLVFPKIPVVQFANGRRLSMQEHIWQCEEYPSIAIHQIPLTMAWAMTIHKIQGATMDMAEIDIGRSVFEYGQTYVALSRVQNLDGLFLTSFHPQKIKANEKVVEFYLNMMNISEEMILSKINEHAIFNEKKIDFKEFEFKEDEIEIKKINENIKTIRF